MEYLILLILRYIYNSYTLYEMNDKYINKIEFNQGQLINLKYSLQEENGTLELKTRDEDDKIVESKRGSGEGNIELKVDKTQKYQVILRLRWSLLIRNTSLHLSLRRTYPGA